MICRFISPVSLIATFQLLTCQLSGRAQNYSISDLSSNDWSYSEAHALSAGGQVVGEYEPLGFIYVKAFLYDDGAITDLNHLSGTPYAVAYGINASNQVVGESNTSNGTHAFVYATGKMTDLGTLGGNYLNGYSSGHAINDSNQVVGESTLSASQVSTIHAVLYSGGAKTDLGALGGNYSSASAINRSGEIVGESDAVDNQGQTNVHAFRYSNGTMTDLGTLGGGYSSAKGINDSGIIVGESETVTTGVTNLHAFMYQNGAMTDLGTLGGSTSSASAINRAGQVVGYATDINEVANAFLYDGSKMINLNDLIPAGSSFTNLATADAINDAGQIAGSGYRADGTYQAYLLALVPAVSVTITNPAANSSFQAPASFTVQATTSDSVGTITNVEFLENSSVIGNATVSPYSADVSSLAAGAYVLTAVAFDSTGLTATNSISINVTSVADLPPTVAITNPAPNASFQAPATFTVDASASDSDGAVTNVQFLINGAMVANVTASPYTVTASNLAAGSYTLTAIAADNAGLTASNSINVTVVAPSDVPPSVTITNPAPNATFAAPATVSIEASALDSDGTVTNVQFLANGALLANVATAPYSAVASNLAAGTYTLAAIASDNAGLAATNSINITVTSPTTGSAVTITQPVFSDNSFSFLFPAQLGVAYAAQSTAALGSTNNWTTFTNLIGAGTTARITDSAAASGSRFYRVVTQ